VLFIFSAVCVTGACHAEPGTNAFNDPFEQVTGSLSQCPAPEGPSLTASEARAESHWRVERGSSCFLSGRCRVSVASRPHCAEVRA
jgi:hypothetical protein